MRRRACCSIPANHWNLSWGIFNSGTLYATVEALQIHFQYNATVRPAGLPRAANLPGGSLCAENTNTSGKRFASAVCIGAGLLAVSAALPGDRWPRRMWRRRPRSRRKARRVAAPIHRTHLLESGFKHLYELNFTAARTDFMDYQQRES